MAAAAAAAVGVLGIRRCGPHLVRRLSFALLEILGRPSNLATKRAELEGIEEAALADLTGVGDAFARPGLWPLVQENNLSAVDYVCLDGADVQVLLNFGDSDNIMVRGPPYLNCAMVLVICQTERAERAVHTVQTVHIAFALVRIGMEFALDEEVFFQQRLQPRRPSVLLLLRSSSFHNSPVLGLDLTDGGFLVIDRQL